MTSAIETGMADTGMAETGTGGTSRAGTCHVETVSDERGWRDFLRLPEAIYRGDPNWVAPLTSEIRRVLDAEANPYFREAELRLFVGYRGDEPTCRAALVINRRHWQRWGRKSAFFGFFESEDDPEAAGALFGAMEAFCRERGAELLEGPFNPNHYSELGLLLGPFDVPPRFFETYNPPTYPRLLEDLGYGVRTRLHTRINRHADRFVRAHPHRSARPRRGFTIRPFDLRRREGDLERIREVNNDAFADNWHFLPLSREEYLFTSKFLFFVTIPELVLIVERGREPVGVLNCVLDINGILRPVRGRLRPWHYPRLLLGRRTVREMVIYSIGVKKRYRHTVASQLMYEATCELVPRYPVVSTTWMTDDNIPALRASALLGLRPWKRFAIYEKAL